MRAPPTVAAVATRLLLVRHGEIDEAAAGRCVGRFDVGLSAAGRRQAAALVPRLRSAAVTAAFSSPSRRALETAAPAIAALGLELVQLPDLQEVDFGSMEGLTWDQVRERHPETMREWARAPAAVRFPGGESLDDVARRARLARARAAAALPGRTVALFGHAGPIRVLLADALRLPLARCFEIDVRPGTVHAVECHP